jgi:hypothetical protein
MVQWAASTISACISKLMIQPNWTMKSGSYPIGSSKKSPPASCLPILIDKVPKMNNTYPRNILRHRWLLLLVVLLPMVSLLTGCSGSVTSAPNGDLNKIAPMSAMPAEVQKAPKTVQQAYQFAIAHPDALKNVPCYCGCGSVGHTSNYSCYVMEIKPSGEVVFDQHALGCSICVDIAKDVLKMTQAGKAPKEIRAAIDQTYSQYGPSNMAPVQ